MTDTEPAGVTAERCPHCGTPLVTGTDDFADTPDHTDEVDLPRAELQPGQMARSAVCPNHDCPGPDTGARV